MKLFLLIFSLILSFVTNVQRIIYPEDTNGEKIKDVFYLCLHWDK